MRRVSTSEICKNITPISTDESGAGRRNAIAIVQVKATGGELMRSV